MRESKYAINFTNKIKNFLVEGTEDMKFFTRQLYEQMQVWSFLTNLLNEDDNDNEEIKKFYQEQGKDYEVEQRHIYEENYKEIKHFLLEYLPESLESIILNELSVYGKMLSESSIMEMKKYIDNFSNLMFDDSDINVGKTYSKYYKSIENSLPEDIRSLNEKYNFHDSQITYFDYSGENKIIIKLSCEGSFLSNGGSAVLTFSDIKSVELSDNYVGNWWLWNETHLSDIGNFDFQALFHNYDDNGRHSLNELRIIADKVSLEFLDTDS
ncbi:hypothetical protein CLMAG_49640 [Clostridium magnum DSM 2767]|uniref:DUF4085 domain-containing protein n=3 Tax=Clostridium magnum TaxID=33954 RepID=A0A161WCR7_9CLOT|nr:hypothetical protein CLMAG_49640 [Clostridium magnum DSM 2767]SHJ30512.1 Protein of unknown function [Clostridium magnum DSM 2767]